MIYILAYSMVCIKFSDFIFTSPTMSGNLCICFSCLFRYLLSYIKIWSFVKVFWKFSKLFFNVCVAQDIALFFIHSVMEFFLMSTGVREVFHQRKNNARNLKSVKQQILCIKMNKWIMIKYSFITHETVTLFLFFTTHVSLTIGYK